MSASTRVTAVSVPEVKARVSRLLTLCFKPLRFPLKALFGAAAASAAFAAALLSFWYLFSVKGLWADFVIPSFAVFFVYASVSGYRYLSEKKRAREIKGIFSSYVTEKVVDELVKNPGLARLGGERKEVTVLFADIKGFTAFSERHEPEEVVALLNDYLKTMTEIVFRWNGTLDKFVGDSIMVFWGAPTVQENHAELALRCALDMLGKLKKLQRRWVIEGKEPFSIGIGINTGEAVVGNMGVEGKKMEYTVIGDHVNLGARAEGLTREFDAEIIVTEFTRRKLGEMGKRFGHLLVEEMDPVRVRGREKPVVVYGIEPLYHGA
ncbi:MAG: adenylate/guanylate cyclase domain-containing protein [Deltaproteobacteria bacterium]|nr:adenylate/guanylate cyclase domain-containing protein [Deltaproteobacteria bacterium]